MGGPDVALPVGFRLTPFAHALVGFASRDRSQHDRIAQLCGRRYPLGMAMALGGEWTWLSLARSAFVRMMDYLPTFFPKRIPESAPATITFRDIRRGAEVPMNATV